MHSAAPPPLPGGAHGVYSIPPFAQGGRADDEGVLEISLDDAMMIGAGAPPPKLGATMGVGGLATGTDSAAREAGDEAAEADEEAPKKKGKKAKPKPVAEEEEEEEEEEAAEEEAE